MLPRAASCRLRQGAISSGSEPPETETVAGECALAHRRPPISASAARRDGARQRRGVDGGTGDDTNADKDAGVGSPAAAADGASTGLKMRPASWPSRFSMFPENGHPRASSSASLPHFAAIDRERVYNFDISKYRDGSFRLIPAAATDKIRYIGRFLHHGARTKRPTKVNAVQFDWPACTFEIRVTNTTSVAIRLKGDGNYFNVFVNDNFCCILRASLNATCCEVVSGLDVTKEYTITISKRTEPQMRGALSTFKVCTFYGFILDGDAEVLPRAPEATRKIEFIGDSDTCAFGNEGIASSTRKIFGMKGRMENVYNGYACILSRMFDAEAHIMAWSGKGVHSNAADWGPNMLALWKNTLACREGEWDMHSWMPDVVVVNLGINDLFPPASSETDIIAAYALLLAEVRSYRPEADIYCVVCHQDCISSENNADDRNRLSQQLQEIVKLAMSKVGKYDTKLHFSLLQVDGGLHDADFATSMHYAVSGHIKIARALAEEISVRTQWKLRYEPTTMPYPQEKKQILVPGDESKKSSCVMIPRATSFCPSAPTVTIDCENDRQLQFSVCLVRPRAAAAAECEIDMRCAKPMDDPGDQFECGVGDVAAVASLPSSLAIV
ncbi:hypothetical protein ATCC90586_010037 [Pythium insidiosum]|nr:hypothetical protein ATCC90586_010037 [Pythium insidiosum]